MTLKVGCGQFAVARARYFETLPTVEVGAAFIDPPRVSTVRAWRLEAPAPFDFSVPASQIVTHPAASPTYSRILRNIPERRRAFCGHFKDTPEVRVAWEATQALATALRAKFIVFETPASFDPEANHLRDLYRFFKAVPRGAASFVWQARGSWEPKLIDKICGDLGLIRARNPLEEPEAAPRGVRYYRLRGSGYTDAQRCFLRRLGAEGQTYLYFTHRTGWLEAKALLMGRAC